MHILMIAPEPFFEPRGTPFSEYHRIRALLHLGHTVDLVTYPFGRDVAMPGLRIVRCLCPPFVRGVRVGPSLAKIPLDAFLALTTVRLAFTRRYDVVHSHEEGSLIGVIVATVRGLPHLYDMHSSLPQQLSNFAFSRSGLLRRLFEGIERLAIRRSRAVVVICPHLGEVVRRVDPSARAFLIENAPGGEDEASPGSRDEVLRTLGPQPSGPIVLYTGTFEHYQGLDLLLAAVPIVRATLPDVRFALVGGRPEQVQALAREADARGLKEAVVLPGERPASEMPAWLEAASVLVSPRSTGTNTPLKIYQYLRAGRPIVATRLLTHTQVLTDEVAALTDPTAAAFAQGIVRVLQDRHLGERLGQAAQQLARERYSYDAYLAKTRDVCTALAKRGDPVAVGL